MPSSRRTPAGRPGRPAASRSGSRPAGQPGSRPRARATERARPRPQLTGRMAVLVVVFAVLVVSYASSLRAYRTQQGRIDALRAQIASSQQELGRLTREKARWDDKAYVEQQARQRFGWVLPGEIAYQVIDKDGKPLDSEDRLSDPNAIVHVAPTAWWAKEYDSLEKADHPPVPPPAPPSKITPKSQ